MPLNYEASGLPEGKMTSMEWAMKHGNVWGCAHDRDKFVFLPVHYHCPKCWSQEYLTLADGQKVCSNLQCIEQPAPEMLVCTPMICASS